MSKSDIKLYVIRTHELFFSQQKNCSKDQKSVDAVFDSQPKYLQNFPLVDVNNIFGQSVSMVEVVLENV